MMTYLLNNDDFSNDQAADWEKDVFIKTIHEFNEINDNNESLTDLKF